MKTGSITYCLPAQADAYRQIPSVSCGTTSFRSFIILLFIICCLGKFEKFCISVNIKQKKYTRPLQHKKIVYGSIETTSHFFFSCPRYTAQRQQYLLNLPHELSVSLLLRGDPNQPCMVNNIILKHAQLYILATKRFL